MLLVVDNGSVYTKYLVEFLNEKNISFKKQTPDVLDHDSLDSFDSFILSGRRYNDRKTNRVNSKIVLHVVNNDKKLFGICYGAEILALALGGTIAKSPRHVKGNEKVTILRANPLCSDEIDVFESHGFEISRLPEKLASLGKSDNCNYEFIQYGQKLIFGTQFHPEMSADGHRLIERFCRL